jgi:DNA-binding beta-propeller fold protein YncE
MKRFLWLGFVLSLYLICTGCGDTFRPIIIPNPPVFPNPRAAHTVLSINDNGAAVSGSAMVIDVSGDTEVSVANVGLAPVYAVQQSARQVLVVNHSVADPQNTGDSLTELTFNGTTIGSTSTISLPPNSAPNFVAVAPSSTTAYVTLPALNEVGVVSTLSGNLAETIPVGTNPDALAVTADNNKLYVANHGSNSISGFNTIDRSQRVGSPASTTSAPIWLAARSDNQRVFVLETNGTLAWLDTTSTAGPDPLTETPISVPSSLKIVYDGNLNRLYIPGNAMVSGTLESAVVIVDAASTPVSPLAMIPITAIPPASRGGQDPCSTTTVGPLNTVDVAALPDGSRAYAGTYYESAVNSVEYICPQVTVIDVASNTVKASIAIPGFAAYDAFCAPPPQGTVRFRIMMAAAGDSSRAYLSSCDGGNVNIIDTTTDTYYLNVPAPVGTRTPIPPSALNPPQNPVFLIAGP